MAEKEYVTGTLEFNPQEGKFWIVKNGVGVDFIEFGDEFEVLIGTEWIKSGLEISNGEFGELVFKLKNTQFFGDLTGIEIRR